jgi:hypothetical protein
MFSRERAEARRQNQPRLKKDLKYKTSSAVFRIARLRSAPPYCTMKSAEIRARIVYAAHPGDSRKTIMRAPVRKKAGATPTSRKIFLHSRSK